MRNPVTARVVRVERSAPEDAMAALKTALLVDDETDVGELLREAVNERGARVDIVADLRSAITCLKRHAYCGLIVNLAIANDDGIGLLRALSDEHITVPIVLITGDMPDSVRTLPVVRQIKLVMAKPIEISLLASICLGLCGMET
ncbi:MAG TPA: response regulator [Thermoanaerobaculia bacterium]